CRSASAPGWQAFAPPSPSAGRRMPGTPSRRSAWPSPRAAPRWTAAGRSRSNDACSRIPDFVGARMESQTHGTALWTRRGRMSLISSRVGRHLATVALLALAAPTAPLSAQLPADLGRVAREPDQTHRTRASELSRPVDLVIHEAPLGDALRQLVHAGAPLIYSTDLVRRAGTVSCDCRGVTLGVALLQLTRGHDIDFREIDSGEVLLVPRPRRTAAAAVRGRVVALDDRRPLASAAVTVVGTNLTVATDDAGRFNI